nr:hypothetical protein [Streptomyces sp. SHP 1-2]
MARVGPASRISSRKATKATAVHTTPRTASAASTRPGGSSAGRSRTAAGACTTAAAVRQNAVSRSEGTSLRWRTAISGATA